MSMDDIVNGISYRAWISLCIWPEFSCDIFVSSIVMALMDFFSRIPSNTQCSILVDELDLGWRAVTHTLNILTIGDAHICTITAFTATFRWVALAVYDALCLFNHGNQTGTSCTWGCCRKKSISMSLNYGMVEVQYRLAVPDPPVTEFRL